MSSPAPRMPPIAAVVLIGDYGAGKTALFRQLTRNIYVDNPTPRLESEQQMVTMAFTDQESGYRRLLKLCVKDTANAERYDGMHPSFYRDAKGVALVYDVNNPTTFSHLPQWYEEAQRLCTPRSGEPPFSPAFVLIGCKLDLCGSLDAMPVPEADATAFAHEYGNMPVVFTSAKEHADVRHAFGMLSSQIQANPALLNGQECPVEFVKCGGTPREKKSFCCAF